MISSSASSCAGYSSNPASAAQSTKRSRIASGSAVPPGGTRAIRDGRAGWRTGSAMAGGLWHGLGKRAKACSAETDEHGHEGLHGLLLSAAVFVRARPCRPCSSLLSFTPRRSYYPPAMNPQETMAGRQRLLLGMSAYQWTVLLAAWLGWGFDVFDGQLFNFVAPNCVPTLLGLKIGSPEARRAMLLWGGVLTSILLVGWGVGGVLFGRVADRVGRPRPLLPAVPRYAPRT